MKTVRILFITTAFPPYEFSEALVNAKLVMALKENGHDIHVISRPATIVYNDAWSGLWESLEHQVYYPSSGKISKLSKISSSLKGILRYKLPVEGIRWGLEAEKLAAELHQEKGFDLIMTRMPSLFPHLLGLRLGKAWNIPVVSNWNDPTDDIRPLGHKVSRKASFFFKLISRRAFSSATLNTFPSRQLLEHYLKTNLKGLTAATEIIPHIGFYPDFSLTHQVGEIPRIVHAGNMLDNIQLDLLLESLHSLAKKGLKFELHVFGMVQEKLLSAIPKLGLENCVFVHNPLGYSEMIEKLVQFDFLLILEAQCPEGILMLSKLSDYASLKKPIIALSPKNGVTANYFADQKGFHLFDNTNQTEIENGLEKILVEFPKHALPEPDNKLWSEVNPAQIVSQYARIFSSIIQPKNTRT